MSVRITSATPWATTWPRCRSGLRLTSTSALVTWVRSAARAFLTGLITCPGLRGYRAPARAQAGLEVPATALYVQLPAQSRVRRGGHLGPAGQAWYVYSGYSRRDLDFVVEQDSAGARLRTFYATDIFDPGDIRAIQRRYSALLTVLAADDQRPMSKLYWRKLAVYARHRGRQRHPLECPRPTAGQGHSQRLTLPPWRWSPPMASAPRCPGAPRPARCGPSCWPRACAPATWLPSSLTGSLAAARVWDLGGGRGLSSFASRPSRRTGGLPGR